MSSLIRSLRQVSLRRWFVYVVAYVWVGMTLQLSAPYLKIAAFVHDWQVFTLYGLFLVPLSALVRDKPWHAQYAYSVVAIAPVDIVGFAWGTSIEYPGNLIAHVVGERSFTLAFVLLAGSIPVVGNTIVPLLEGALFGRRRPVPVTAAMPRGEAVPLAAEGTRFDGDRESSAA